MSTTAAISQPAQSQLEPYLDPEFVYGWRDVVEQRPDGSTERVRIPLTAADALHPKIGDVILERSKHNRERDYIRRSLTGRTPGRRVMVYSDLLIVWGVPGVGDHSPDVSAFEGIEDPVEMDRESLHVAEEGAEPRLTVEIVSPRDRDPQARANDTVAKLDHYHQVGVPVYVIVDQERRHGPRRVVGYRHTPREYMPIAPDARGRIFLDFFNVWIGVRDNLIVCYDGDTDEEILEDPALKAAIRTLSEVNRAAEQHAQAETDARRAAERFAQAEADAHRAAEQRVQAEAAARSAAERRAQAAEHAAREAEIRAEAEAQARTALEARLRELEAKLQGQGGSSESSPTS